jgi:hypothetical protein
MRLATLPRHLALGLLCLAPASAAFAQGDRDTRYGHYRVVEGSADVLRDGETREEAEENMPLVTGDRLWTGATSRVEVVLPDGTLVRVGGNTEVTFDELARSGDGTAGGTLLYLDSGEVHVVTDETAGVAEYPRLDTPAATVYLEGAGSYRIEAAGGTTGVVVRRGFAELVTRRGTTRVGDGQEAWVDGSERPAVQVAGAQSALERWGSVLEGEYRRAAVDRDVDRSLGYSASRMNGHGNWVQVDSRRAWRPRVAADWSPYRHGRWQYTPSGLTWVSYEPWGWVPYHYGSWDHVPNWGWVWYPGRAYAPAWVYWYWGPSQVGWCPIGYYYRLYGSRGYGYGHDWHGGFRFGVHGWAGGRADRWNRWNFVDCRYLNDRRLSHHTRWAHQLGVADLPRGVIATDTRGMRPAIATRPNYGMRTLLDHPSRAGGRDLPDISGFVAGDPGVSSDDVRHALPVDDRVSYGDDGRGYRPMDEGGAARAGRTRAAYPDASGGSPDTSVSSHGRGGSPRGNAAGDDGSSRSTDGGGVRVRPELPDATSSDDNGVRPRTAPPARTSPGSRGDVGDDSGAATGRGARVRPELPPASGDGGGPSARTAPPTRSSPPDDGDGNDRGVSSRQRPPVSSDDAPSQPRVRTGSDDRGRPANDDSATSSSPDDAWRSSGGTGQRSAPRAYTPPQGRGNTDVGVRSQPAGGVTSRGGVTRQAPAGDDGWRQAPARGNDGGAAAGSRAVPPVRRVVDGVRGSSPNGRYSPPSGGPSGSSSDDQYTPPPRSTTSRGGYTAPPATGSYGAPPRSSGGGYAAPRSSGSSSGGPAPSYSPPAQAPRQPAAAPAPRAQDPGNSSASSGGNGRRGRSDSGSSSGSSNGGGGRGGRSSRSRSSSSSSDGGGGQGAGG